MREIKFRAWSEKFRKYVGFWGVYPHDCGAYQSGPFSGSGEPFVNEQFTGLLDKNGREIYEGDIVRSVVLFSGELINTTVRWIDCGFIANGLLGTRESENCEVIGNIHENPDLLLPS